MRQNKTPNWLRYAIAIGMAIAFIWAMTSLALGFNAVPLKSGTVVPKEFQSGDTISGTYGGMGINTSASTGVPSVTAGTWSIAATLGASLGGTGQDTSASTGVPYISSGTWATETTLDETRGGTGLDTSASTGQPYLSSGTWSIQSDRHSIENITRDMTAATGAVSYTGAGFAPTAVIAFCSLDNDDVASWGVADATSDSSTTAYFGGVYGNNANFIGLTSAGSTSQAFTVTSFDATGITGTWTKTGSPTGTANCQFFYFR